MGISIAASVASIAWPGALAVLDTLSNGSTDAVHPLGDTGNLGGITGKTVVLGITGNISTAVTREPAVICLVMSGQAITHLSSTGFCGDGGALKN